MKKMPWRWGLTPGEKRAVLFISAALLVGLGYRLYQRYTLPESLPLNARDSLAVEAIRKAYFRAAQQDFDSTVEKGVEESPDRGSNQDSETVQLLNLNTASQEQLEDLPGIGPVLARRIIEERVRLNGFISLDDLLAVPGIGPGRLERIRSLVCCAPIEESNR